MRGHMFNSSLALFDTVSGAAIWIKSPVLHLNGGRTSLATFGCARDQTRHSIGIAPPNGNPRQRTFRCLGGVRLQPEHEVTCSAGHLVGGVLVVAVNVDEAPAVEFQTRIGVPLGRRRGADIPAERVAGRDVGAASGTGALVRGTANIHPLREWCGALDPVVSRANGLDDAGVDR